MNGLKGVSRSVVEMQLNDSTYFERAVFYLKPNVSGIPIRSVHNEAEHWLHVIAPRQKGLPWHRMLRLLAVAMGSGAVGAVITALVIFAMK